MKEVHDHYATLPYKNTLKSAARKALYPRWSMTRPSVFIYGKLIVGRTSKPALASDRGFLTIRRLRVSEGNYSPAWMLPADNITIEKHTRLPLQPCSCQFRMHLVSAQRLPLVVCICQFRLKVCLLMVGVLGNDPSFTG